MDEQTDQNNEYLAADVYWARRCVGDSANKISQELKDFYALIAHLIWWVNAGIQNPDVQAAKKFRAHLCSVVSMPNLYQKLTLAASAFKELYISLRRKSEFVVEFSWRTTAPTIRCIRWLTLALRSADYEGSKETGHIANWDTMKKREWYFFCGFCHKIGWSTYQKKHGKVNGRRFVYGSYCNAEGDFGVGPPVDADCIPRCFV